MRGAFTKTTGLWLICALVLALLGWAIVPWIAVSRPGINAPGVAPPEQLAVMFGVLVVGARLLGRRVPRLVSQGAVALGLLWAGLLLSRVLAQALAPGPPAWAPDAVGQSQNALLLASGLAALAVNSARKRLADAGGRAAAIAIAIALAWTTSDACQGVLIATRPNGPNPASLTAEELAARGLLVALATGWAVTHVRVSTRFMWVTALCGPLLAALGGIGLIWIALGAYAELRGTWLIAAAGCGTLLGIWTPIAVAANRSTDEAQPRWLVVLRLASTLALAEEGTRGIIDNLAPGSGGGFWLVLSVLQVSAAAALGIVFVPAAIRVLFEGERPAALTVLRRLAGIALFSLAAKQLAEVVLAWFVAHAAPDAGWTTRLLIYGVGFALVRLVDLGLRLRTGRGLASRAAGPPGSVAVRRLETELVALIGLGGAVSGALAVLAPAAAVTFSPVEGGAAIAHVWPVLPGIGAMLALAVRACTRGRHPIEPDQGPRLLDLEPQLGFVIAAAAVLVGLVGVIWSILAVAASGPLAAEVLMARLGVFAALALLGTVAAVEYRRTSVLIVATTDWVARGPVLIVVAGCLIVGAYAVSALVGACLAPTLLPTGAQLPTAQPLACLVASAVLLPLFVRMARADRRRICAQNPNPAALERRLLVWLPTGAMTAPLAVSLLVRGVAPSAAPGGMTALSLLAGGAGLALTASVGLVCQYATTAGWKQHTAEMLLAQLPDP